jgi:SPP1 family predicted phage head-tail adaptor
MLTSFMDAGLLRDRLELERPVDVSDGQGGVARSFEPVRELWARIEPLRQSADEIAGGQVARLTHRIWMRHAGDIDTTMRFVRHARIFAIRTIHDPDERRRYLVCLCEEIRP